jgi:hypothetical protein
VKITPERLGPPELKIAGFQLWVHSYELDDWLQVSAHCGAKGAEVWAAGSLLMLGDIAVLKDGCKHLLDGSIREAIVSPLEPEISLTLRREDDLGHILLKVRITPDHMTQSHEFAFDIDQSHLPTVIKSCESIIQDSNFSRT